MIATVIWKIQLTADQGFGRGVFRLQSNIYDKSFDKIGEQYLAVKWFSKYHYHRFFTGS